MAETIAALPPEAGPEVTDKATQLLVSWAYRFDPTILEPARRARPSRTSHRIWPTRPS